MHPSNYLVAGILFLGGLLYLGGYILFCLFAPISQRDLDEANAAPLSGSQGSQPDSFDAVTTSEARQDSRPAAGTIHTTP